MVLRQYAASAVVLNEQGSVYIGESAFIDESAYG